MKKYFLMLVILFTTSVSAFAEDTNATEMDAIARYDLKVNIRRLSTFLDLNSDQIDGVTSVETEFKNDLMFAAVECSNDNRRAVAVNAINKHIKHIRYILNDEQYRKYLVVLNATIKNRELVD